MFDIRPISLKTAQQFVTTFHRHNKKPQGHKFSVGLYKFGCLVGIGTAGRPVARMLDDGVTLEIVRTCTLGDRNANSAIYGALARAAKALGYRKIITYTQADETGASLRGAGWKVEATLPARGGWDSKSRPREDIGSANVERVRWSLQLLPSIIKLPDLPVITNV